MPRDQHPLEVYRFDEMVEEGLTVHEKIMRDLLRSVLFELQRLNKHMQVITDEEVAEDDST